MSIRNKYLILCNTAFLLYFLSVSFAANDLMMAALVNMLIFVVPGLGWVGLLKNKITDSSAFLFYMFLFSIIAHLVLLIGHRLLGIEPKPMSFLTGLFVLTNAGIFFSKPTAPPSILNSEKNGFSAAIVTMCLIFVCIVTGMKLIPALGDQDGEHQGTAYGLIYELKPYFTYDILPIPYYFSHPTLTNFTNAYSILLFGELNDFKYYYETAKNTEKILQLGQREEMNFQLKDLSYQAVNINNSDYFLSVTDPIDKNIIFQAELSKANLIEYLYEQDRRKFNENPQIFSTRVSNIFASLFIFCIFLAVITSLTGSHYLGLLGGVMYIFTPGIFVRSCFSAHFAFTNCFFLLLAYQYINPERFVVSKDNKNLWLIIPGIIAALINQKILIIVGAIVFARGLQYLNNPKKSVSFKQLIMAEPIITGYFLGTLLFWSYGLLIDHQAFILAHIRVHTIDRLLHINTMFAEDYPSVLKLWWEFLIEFPYLILALIGLGFGVRTYAKDRMNIFLLWFFCGAFIFSIVDWKLTNHLMYIVSPSIVALMIFVSRQEKALKKIFLTCIFSCLIYSIWFDGALMNNFDFYLPTGGW